MSGWNQESPNSGWAEQPEKWRKLDPYLFWAECTDFAGYRRRDGKIRVAVELSDHKTVRAKQANFFLALHQAEATLPPEFKRLELSRHYANMLDSASPPRHFTARLDVSILVDVFAPKVSRLKAGLAGLGDNIVDLSAQPSEMDWGLIEKLLILGEVSTVAQKIRVALNAGFLPLPFATRKRAKQNGKANTGRPVMGVIDFGCPFAHSHFRRQTSKNKVSTRIRHFWDQGRVAEWAPGLLDEIWSSEADFGYGRESNSARLSELMNKTLQLGKAGSSAEVASERLCYARAGLPELLEPCSHGAHVMDIAAGLGFTPEGQTPLSDAAADADIIFVQLPDEAVQDLSGGWLAVYVIDAIEYIVKRARNNDPPGGARTPVVINLSYGNNAGSHDGRSILEEAISDYCNGKDVVIVLAAGNIPEHLYPVHAQASIPPDAEASFDWCVPANDPTQSFLELWYFGKHKPPIELSLHAPGDFAPLLLDTKGAARLLKQASAVPACAAAALLMPECLAGGPSGMALVALAPTRIDPRLPKWTVAAPPGRWKVSVKNLSATTTISVDAWLERDQPGRAAADLPPQSFLQAAAGSLFATKVDGTLTCLATGRGPLVVGGSVANATAAGQGRQFQLGARGPARSIGARRNPRPGPDLAAPAARIVGNQLRGLVAAGNVSAASVEMDGTSMSAPWVARWVFNELARRAAAKTPAKRRVSSSNLLAALAAGAVKAISPTRSGLGVGELDVEATFVPP